MDLLQFFIIFVFVMASFAALLLLFASVQILWSVISFFVLKRCADTRKKGEDYAAIILLRKCWLDGWLRFGEGLLFLVLYLRRINYPYKRFYWLTPKKIHEIICDSEAKQIYILGHGAHHFVKTDNKEFYMYCEAKNAPKKEYVGLYHCAAGPGKSLKEYIGKDGYVAQRNKLGLENNFIFLRMLFAKK